MVSVVLAYAADWSSHLETLRGLLSPDEQSVANAFQRREDADDYVMAHAVARLVIARETGVPARSLRLGRRSQGKPFVIADDKPFPIEFSLSHTRGLAGVITSRSASVGIDLESMANSLDASTMRSIASEHLPAHVQAALAATEGDTLEREFLSAWTRNEAWLKALGIGVTARVAPSYEPVAVQSFDPGPPWLGALAVVGPLVPPVTIDRLLPAALSALSALSPLSGLI